MSKKMKNVRYVKFTPEEMAYEPPAEIDFSKVLLIRGYENWRRFRQWKRQMAQLDADVREAFPTNQSVNDALRKVIEIQQMKTTKQKKSA
jgi:hypothetical protein